MAASAAQKVAILRNLGHVQNMFDHMIEAMQGQQSNTIKDWRNRNGRQTTGVPVNGSTDLVLIAAMAEMVSTFAAS